MSMLNNVMSPHVKVIHPDATIAEAAKQMRDGGFGMLPVGENDRMIGAISDRDIAIRGVAAGKPGGGDTTARNHVYGNRLVLRK